MNENLNTDKLFREKLDGFSVQPPPHVWGNVQGKLVAQQRKKRIAYISWISAAAVVLLAFLAGWYFNDNSEITIPLSAEQKTVQPKTEIESAKIDKSAKQILSSKLIQIQQSDNKNIQDKSVLNPNSTLPAVHLNPGLADENTSTNNTYKRVKMQMLKSIDVIFEKEQLDVFLAEKTVPKRGFGLYEPDKFLIAENSKNISSTNKTSKGWKMGMVLSPGYSSHVSSHSQKYSQNMNYTSERGNENIGGGFSIQYKTSKKLSLESGVYYAQNGQKSVNSLNMLFASNNKQYAAVSSPDNNYDLTAIASPGFSNSINVRNGNISMNAAAGVIKMSGTPKGVDIISELDGYNPSYTNTLVSDGEFSQVFDFVEIPLYLRYKVLDSKFDIEIMGGVNAGLVVGNNAYIHNSYGLQNIGKTQDISTVNLSGTVGVGIDYALGKHISVALEPRLNYFFNSINSSPEVDFRPYRIGVFTGVYYEF
ncbi:MAG: hypothetical protein L3J11_08600 [Draconibacterium sp.]|nr:hypothetical protein [Draconibacterium sp.]